MKKKHMAAHSYSKGHSLGSSPGGHRAKGSGDGVKALSLGRGVNTSGGGGHPMDILDRELHTQCAYDDCADEDKG